jgi:uncharacterized protein DUF2625
MKELYELIDREDPGWPLVQQWIKEARNRVEVLPPPDDATRERALVATQVTTRSPMGAIIYESGGILVDHGWLRILGSGHPRLPRSVANWNFGRSFSVAGARPEFVLVADDVVGGFFAIDGGGLGFEQGKVCYFAPDALEWENTEKGYSDFLIWCFQGDLGMYYENARWPNWQHEVQEVAGDQALGFLPPLSEAGPLASERRRQPMPVAEIYSLHVLGG